MTDITKDKVDHIAKLARVKLSESEEEKMAKDLGAILTYIDKLNEVDTEGVEPTAQVTGMQNVLRKDANSDGVWWNGNPFDLVEVANNHEGRLIKVKEVFKDNNK